ncbi:hypothetical protein G7046_g6224 [Stylonectria norvegica]|nr:hypothetical protein G7046_g6224 [Stylonectria norvegica]
MAQFVPFTAVFVALLSILIFVYSPADYSSLLRTFTSDTQFTVSSTTITESISTTSDIAPSQKEQMLNTVKNMSKSLRHAKITLQLSSERGHSDHGWLNSYHSFSFADWYNPKYTQFGQLRILNEDRVSANSGFPTHPHRDFEIFSYILSGELTHRDSMIAKGKEGDQSDKFFRMKRGDVQFTTGGSGIAHSETNEHRTETVHFLQIWAFPWKRGLVPRYHTRSFSDDAKREAFVKILSPLKGGEDATAQEEKDAEAVLPDTIPIHSDFVMGAGIIAPGKTFEWIVGANATQQTKRKVFVLLPMTKGGRSKIRLDGREDAELSEGDGAFVDIVNAGDKLSVESIGEVEAEVIVLDTA